VIGENARFWIPVAVLCCIAAYSGQKLVRTHLDETIREELLLSFPMRFLCQEDCPGLCPKCGKPRREGDCGCPTFEPDPRLAVLKKLLDKNEENEDQ
jgi:uncharacterized protein